MNNARLEANAKLVIHIDWNWTNINEEYRSKFAVNMSLHHKSIACGIDFEMQLVQ